MTIPTLLDRPIEAIAWDVDGTLIDSEPTHLKALLATCTAHRVDISDLADDAFVGVSLHGVWEAIGARFPASLGRDAWIGEINGHYAGLSGDIPRTARCGLSSSAWRGSACARSRSPTRTAR